MSEYYYEDGCYSSKKKGFPWFIMIMLMLVSAVGGGFFSYYLLEDSLATQVAALTPQTIKNGENATVINTTQMVLSAEAMDTLLQKEGAASVVDLIYGAVADVYDLVNPSIVGISNIVSYSSYFNGFNRNEENNVQEVEQSTGSGVIYSEDGYIVTNYHVIEGASRLMVTLSDGTQEEAKLIGADERTDLALLKIDRKGLPAAQFGSSADLRVGDLAIAIGNPGGESFSRSLTMGAISGLNRVVETAESLQLSMIQTDAAINPGNSGGALVNSKGQVIGINTIKISSTAYEGMGFALPIDSVKQIVADLKQYGKVIRPALGINMLRDIDSIFAEYNKLPVQQGVLVAPTAGGAAEKAGIVSYDIITAIDDTEITTASEIQNIIFKHQIGDKVTVRIYRYTTDKTFDVEIVLGTLE